MQAQQLLDNIIKPTLLYMGNNYNGKNAQMLLLATAAIESNCGFYIKQIGGPAEGIWQMEPNTEKDILLNSDILQKDDFRKRITALMSCIHTNSTLVISPTYACAMARLKYSMDPLVLPYYKDRTAIYNYYKRIYNSKFGASTFSKFNNAWISNGLDRVNL